MVAMYAICNVYGVISAKLAPDTVEGWFRTIEANGRSWIDEPRNDLDEDGVLDARGLSQSECEEKLKSMGGTLLYHTDAVNGYPTDKSWAIWSVPE